MKKQILFLAIFTLALIFAGTTKSNAQNALTTAPGTCPPPTTIVAACAAVADQLAPLAGQPYTYTVEVPTPVGGEKTFQWFVTKDPTFISGGILTPDPEVIGDGVILAEGTGYNNPATGTASIVITWDFFVHDPAAPVFLVVYVGNTDDVATPGVECSNDNLEAYIIKPAHSFTLDVANVGLDGAIFADGGDGPCVAPVASAIWVAGAGDGVIQFDYGTNYLYYMVTAANFSASWLPSFQVSGAGLGAGRTVTAVDWQTTTLSTTGTGWNTTTLTGSTYTAGVAVPASAASGGVVGSTGECIVVRVTVANGTDETIVPEAITLAVDGVMQDPNAASAAAYYTNLALGDIHYEAGAGAGEDCPWVDEFVNDVVTQLILPRPDVNAIDPTPFTPTNKQ